MRIFSDIESNGSDGSSVEAADPRERIRTNLAGVGAIMALASARGGVGKSMLAVNIAAALATKGRKVAIVDADLNSPSITAMLGMKPQRRSPDDSKESSRPPARMACASFRAISFPAASRRRSASRRITKTAPTRSAVAPAPARPAELSYREPSARMLAQSQFGSVDLLIIDLASGLDRLHSLAVDGRRSTACCW